MRTIHENKCYIIAFSLIAEPHPLNNKPQTEMFSVLLLSHATQPPHHQPQQQSHDSKKVIIEQSDLSLGLGVTVAHMT